MTKLIQLNRLKRSHVNIKPNSANQRLQYMSLSLCLNNLSLICCITAGLRKVWGSTHLIFFPYILTLWLSCVCLQCGIAPLGVGLPGDLLSLWQHGGRSWWQCCHTSSRLRIPGCTAFLGQTVLRNHLMKGRRGSRAEEREQHKLDQLLTTLNIIF